MSADPSQPGDLDVLSGGFVLKNLMYELNPFGSGKVLLSAVKPGTKQAEQRTIPPYTPALPSSHPCAFENDQLAKCNATIDAQVLLGGRCAICNSERKNLMKCLTKHKYTDV